MHLILATVSQDISSVPAQFISERQNNTSQMPSLILVLNPSKSDQYSETDLTDIELQLSESPTAEFA